MTTRSAILAFQRTGQPASSSIARTSGWVLHANAVIVAASENHPPETPWALVPEEYLTHTATTAGRPPAELIRADMTFFETANGKGAVFSTGSITFCGSLPSNGYDNNISRLLANVLDRFLDPLPFEVAGLIHVPQIAQ